MVNSLLSLRPSFHGLLSIFEEYRLYIGLHVPYRQQFYDVLSSNTFAKNEGLKGL